MYFNRYALAASGLAFAALASLYAVERKMSREFEARWYAAEAAKAGLAVANGR